MEDKYVWFLAGLGAAFGISYFQRQSRQMHQIQPPRQGQVAYQPSAQGPQGIIAEPYGVRARQAPAVALPASPALPRPAPREPEPEETEGSLGGERF